jgi:hypothetical protein
LTGLVLLCFPPAAWFLHARHGENGLVAAAVAAVVCWIAGLFALAVHTAFRSPKQAVIAALGAMLVRTTFVFGTMIVLTAASPALRGGGFASAVVFFFLVTLAAETAFALWSIRPNELNAPNALNKPGPPAANGAMSAMNTPQDDSRTAPQAD